jgi:DNA-binding NarL/FixJ family response regulator
MSTSSFQVKIRVAVVEVNPTEREYLLGLVLATPGLKLSGAYGEVAEALLEFQRKPPDVVMVDLDSLDGRAEAWLKELHRQLPYAPVLILSSNASRDQVFRILEEGVVGWLDKPCPADQIGRAILRLHEGGSVLSSRAAHAVLDYFCARGLLMQRLTLRQREILRLLCQGLQTMEIAERIGLSTHTVRTHLGRVLAKLGANSRAGALVKYFNPLVAGPALEKALPASCAPTTNSKAESVGHNGPPKGQAGESAVLKQPV